MSEPTAAELEKFLKDLYYRSKVCDVRMLKAAAMLGRVETLRSVYAFLARLRGGDRPTTTEVYCHYATMKKFFEAGAPRAESGMEGTSKADEPDVARPGANPGPANPLKCDPVRQAKLKKDWTPILKATPTPDLDALAEKVVLDWAMKHPDEVYDEPQALAIARRALEMKDE